MHRVGGHSDGLQVVGVETARGPVALASTPRTLCHLQRRNRFRRYNVGDMVLGWETSSGWRAIPIVSFPPRSIVSEIYPRASDKVDAFALHLAHRGPL